MIRRNESDFRQNAMLITDEKTSAPIPLTGITIADLRLDEDTNSLHFALSDGRKFKIYDDGKCCCEWRYMRTDDKLSDYIGATLLGAELRDAPSVSDDCGEHEVQFLVFFTSAGPLTMSNHNEHNGFYGGFSLRAEWE